MKDELRLPRKIFLLGVSCVVISLIRNTPWSLKGSAILVYFPYFGKIKIGLCNHHFLCVVMYSPRPLLNAWIILCETWYVFHDTWPHLICVLHKSISSVFVYMCTLYHNRQLLNKNPLAGARQRLGENVTAATNTDATIGLLDALFSM
jgi:hypothetical protein